MTANKTGEKGADRDKLDEKAKKWVKVPIAHQSPGKRISNFDEVMHGLTKEQAIEEAGRCMNCKKVEQIAEEAVADLAGIPRVARVAFSWLSASLRQRRPRGPRPRSP
jgi:hypothetical protein